MMMMMMMMMMIGVERLSFHIQHEGSSGADGLSERRSSTTRFRHQVHLVPADDRAHRLGSAGIMRPSQVFLCHAT